MTTLREAAQEPVAWLYQHGETGRTRIVLPDQVFTNAPGQWELIGPLHLHPPRREWQNLTDDEIKKILGPLGSWGPTTPVKGYTRKLFDEIEQALKEKNT